MLHQPRPTFGLLSSQDFSLHWLYWQSFSIQFLHHVSRLLSSRNLFFKLASLVLIILDPTLSSYLIIVPNDHLPGSCLRKLSFKLTRVVYSNDTNHHQGGESSQEDWGFGRNNLFVLRIGVSDRKTGVRVAILTEGSSETYSNCMLTSNYLHWYLVISCSLYKCWCSSCHLTTLPTWGTNIGP